MEVGHHHQVAAAWKKTQEVAPANSFYLSVMSMVRKQIRLPVFYFEVYGFLPF